MKKAWVLSVISALSLFGGEMVLIKGGSFTMGNAKGKPDEAPHEVTVSSFYMDVTEVTQKEYASIMGNNPAKFQKDNQPVERTRWTEAALFCNLRSKAEGLTPCYDTTTWACNFEADGYRLPTEAEWEYACRAGSKTPLSFKGTEKQMDAHGWTRSNSRESTHPVSKKKANAFGLYDMYGNVAEWCNDYYTEHPEGGKDPRGPATGKKRVLRGGSWQDRPKHVNSTARQADDPATADICQGYDTYGFRCVRKAK